MFFFQPKTPWGDCLFWVDWKLLFSFFISTNRWSLPRWPRRFLQCWTKVKHIYIILLQKNTKDNKKDLSMLNSFFADVFLVRNLPFSQQWFLKRCSRRERSYSDFAHIFVDSAVNMCQAQFKHLQYLTLHQSCLLEKIKQCSKHISPCALIDVGTWNLLLEICHTS